MFDINKLPAFGVGSGANRGNTAPGAMAGFAQRGGNRATPMQRPMRGPNYYGMFEGQSRQMTDANPQGFGERPAARGMGWQPPRQRQPQQPKVSQSMDINGLMGSIFGGPVGGGNQMGGLMLQPPKHMGPARMPQMGRPNINQMMSRVFGGGM